MKDKSDCMEAVHCIGLRIAYFRKLKKMTQAQLATKININKNYLSQIESGATTTVISLPLLIRIANALDVELSILVDLEDIDSKKKEMRKQFDEIKVMFDEMKAFNDELDKMLEDMQKTDFIKVETE